MKKLAFISVVLLLAAMTLCSCKKNYTCECTYTAGGHIVSANAEYKDETKKDAEDACNEFKTQISFLGADVNCVLK